MNTFTDYGDKEILADALSSEKASTSVYNTLANECVHPEIRETLIDLLNEEHDIQFDVFNAMHKRGYYPTPPAEQEKVNQAIQTHAPQVKC